jgi:rod shape-determining protein MreD
VLGLADDLVSGQPLGSAVLLWSLAVLALEVLEFRLPWRSFMTEWAFAGLLIAVVLLAGVGFANLTGGASRVVLVVPQMAASVLAWPLAARGVAWLDRVRLIRLRRLG